jgi:hypothetical protein
MKEAVKGVIGGKFSIRKVAESIWTTTEFLKLAFDVAKSLRIPHIFNRGKTNTGKDIRI